MYKKKIEKQVEQLNKLATDIHLDLLWIKIKTKILNVANGICKL